MEIGVFGEILTLTCKTLVKVTCFMKTWNDPTVNTNILPQMVSHKTIIKVYVLTKVLNSIFPKVWNSFPAQYSIIWRNSCGNFDDNSIRTRLAWSQRARNQKNHEFILDCCGFGARRQRRQPVNAPRHGPAMPSTGVSDQSDVVPTSC